MGAIESTSLLAHPHRHDETSSDHAQEKGRMPLAQLERYLEDLRWEPPWRYEADRCCEYYDNNQLDSQTLQALEARGMGPLIRNIIKPTIDTILGLEERTKTDWRVTTDYEDQTEVADALSVKLSEAEKASQADRAISESYAGMVKAGFACVEVSRNSNPFEYPYRVKAIHRREIYWDQRDNSKDWSDSRYVIRKRWYDVDVACAYFPKHKLLIEQAIDRWAGWESLAAISLDGGAQDLHQSLEIERGTKIDDSIWRDMERRRVCIHEVWYRVWYRGMVLKLPRGRVVEFNPKSPQQMALVQAGVTRPQEAVYDKLRCAYFVGPHRLADYDTGRRRLPYVPFWAYREDTTGVPYGQIRSMISTQDEVNARAANMMWLLKARRTLIDADALHTDSNTLADAEHEMGRADAFLVLNPNRRNGPNAVTVMENLQLAEAQRVAMVEAIQAMSQVSGVFPSMMGQTSSTTAARAIQQLIDQGTTGLAEMNGNYAWGRREVGDRLLELIREDLTDASQVAVDTGTSTRSIYINRRIKDPDTGQEIVENSVQNAIVKVTLADMPSSPSHRESQFAQLSDLIKSLPPELQVTLTPFIIEASNQPKRKEMAKLLRAQFGIIDEKSPEGQAAKKQAEELAAAQAQQMAQVFDADMNERKARTDKLLAEAQKIRAEAGIDDSGKAAEIMQLRQDYDQKILKLMGEKMRLQADREIESAQIEMDAEAKALESKEETAREKLRLESQERIAGIEKVADDKIAAVNDQMKDLAEEVDGQLADILAKLEAQRVKDDAKRQIEKATEKADSKVKETTLVSKVEKRIAGIDKKVAVAKAKPAAKKPAAKK